MKVLAIVPSIFDTNPGQRFRIEQWAPYLEQEGIEIDYAPFEDTLLREVLYQGGRIVRKASLIAGAMRRRRRLLASLSSYDAVYLFREAAVMGPPWIERRIASTGIPMVFDFDDAIFVAYRSPANGYLSYLKFPGKTAEICRASRHVIAGNRYLADYAARAQPNVTIVPTTIDTSKYVPEQKRGSKGIPVLGWTGSYSTLQHLKLLGPALQKLRKIMPFRLRVIGSLEYSLEGVEIENVRWSSQREILDLVPIDVGVMPLPADPWSKGKCGLKALQYMALGIPAVCSPVGVNTEIISHGENGLLAGTEEQWIEALTTLLQSPGMRRSMGEQARATVEERYSARRHVPVIAKIFKSL